MLNKLFISGAVRIGFFLLFFIALIPLTSSFSQTASDVAAIQGPDRMQKLIEGARKENALSIYSSATLEDMTIISGAFEKKYGIKVKLWRASSEDLSQRTMAEFRAGRNDVDTYETTGLVMEYFHRSLLLL